MKKIILFFIIFLFSIVWVNANFNIISNDSLFFQNLDTKEIKYVSVKTYRSRFLFNYYLLNYINKLEIWWNNKLEKWKLIRVERKQDDYNTNITTISNYLTWAINVWYSWINLYEHWFTWTLTDTYNLKKLSFSDLTYKEKLIFYSNIFLDFFWFGFLFFLPLNIIVFFCFWYLLFLLYEKYWFKLFKNVYINSAFIYIIVYIFQIIFWLAFLELAAWQLFWFMSYFIFVFPFKLIIYLISYHILEKFNKKYPDKKINVKKVLWYYVILIVGSILIVNIFK